MVARAGLCCRLISWVRFDQIFTVIERGVHPDPLGIVREFPLLFQQTAHLVAV